MPKLGPEPDANGLPFEPFETLGWQTFFTGLLFHFFLYRVSSFYGVQRRFAVHGSSLALVGKMLVVLAVAGHINGDGSQHGFALPACLEPLEFVQVALESAVSSGFIAAQFRQRVAVHDGQK
jgi:hypothetical protein